VLSDILATDRRRSPTGVVYIPLIPTSLPQYRGARPRGSVLKVGSSSTFCFSLLALAFVLTLHLLVFVVRKRTHRRCFLSVFTV
jgi:hypothetical protein